MTQSGKQPDWLYLSAPAYYNLTPSLLSGNRQEKRLHKLLDKQVNMKKPELASLANILVLLFQEAVNKRCL